ncbi:MAG TPA: M56 family metallopeptidase [Chryseolinea sp.]
MNAFINYLLEANLGLCFFLVLYWTFLRRETDFTFARLFLLISIAVSLLFPLLHFTAETRLLPSIGSLVPASWLPEIVVMSDGVPQSKETQINFDVWLLMQVIYGVGAVIMLLIFVTRLFKLLRLIHTTPSYPIERFTILESSRDQYASFSFFNFIFIGNSSELSEREKALIIEHERVHAQRLHSFDVLLTNLLGIIFWFNPLIKIYKKIFIHLHEYEADARTVKYHNVNDYCGLLAKVALLSADIRLANHFSNSLTLKRIEMIRKIRSKIKWWKIAFIGSMIPLFFIAVSCNDQLANDVTELARNANVALDAPQGIIERFEAVKEKNPNSTYILVEFNEKAEKLLAKMEKAHGIPASIELFTPDNGFYKNSAMNTEPEKISFNQSQEWEAAAGLRTFAIIEYNSMASKVAERAKRPQDVYTVLEQTALPSNGLAAFYEHASRRISYPAEARRLGIQGKVFVEFIVETDGSISEIQAIKGIGGGCDEVAVDAVESSPAKWIPGKSKGVAVRQVIVLPITFKLAGAETTLIEETPSAKNTMNEIVVAAYK